MKIAIIGSDISGLTAAYYLAPRHDITVYESASRLGGHTATVDVDNEGESIAIDTGCIVYNDWTYPKFIELMNEIGVSSKPTEMSFSVRCDDSGLEYGGNNINTLFAQRSNLFKPYFLSMVQDILRFNREAIEDLDNGNISESITLGEYLSQNGYRPAFIDKYLLPMGCAIWSASTDNMISFPLLFFARFLKNHGLLSVNNRPQWRVIEGGSRSYLAPLTQSFKDSIKLNSNIQSVRRCDGSIELSFSVGNTAKYDHVIFACHSDQTLGLLRDASKAERNALTAIPYQDNEVVLHTDESLLPNRKLAWSSWNYWLRQNCQERAVLTYNMNIPQGLNASKTYCVTLNAIESIDANKIIERFNYNHPVFSLESIGAAQKIKHINGRNRTWLSGAYLGNGFHEDGVTNGRSVADSLNRNSLSSVKNYSSIANALSNG